jgi:hypothetical protein
MRLLSALFFAVTAAAACKCEATYGPCREAASANVIFVGTVESIAPTFLDTWNESQKASLELLNREYDRAGGDHSPAAFARLRDAYLKVFPDLPPEHKRRLERAASSEDLSSLFYWIIDHGKRVRFTVRTLYRNGDEDDEDDEKPGEAPRTMEIWTSFGECGVSFQTGETYLVYADSDEESDVVTTTACHRTARLSDAGDDLAYLFFRKNQRKQSARLEALVTTGVELIAVRDRDHYATRIASPAAATVVQADDGVRRVRATADEFGRAVFDGLAPGDYQLTVFAPGYPQVKQTLLTQKITIDAHGCANEVLLVPK